MRNKKRILIALFVLALAIVGVGYAAVTQTLKVNGTAQTVSDTELSKNLNVYFNACTDKSIAPLKGEVTTSFATKPTTITLETSGFAKKNDRVVVALEVKNGSAEYKVKISATSTVDDRFTLTYDFRSSADATTAGSQTASSVAVGGSTYLFVTITLKKAPVAEFEGAEFAITLTAQAIA